MSHSVQKKSIYQQTSAFRQPQKKYINQKKEDNPNEKWLSFGKRVEFSTFLYAIFAGIIAVILYQNGFGDHDLLWHAKLGEYIGTVFEIPTKDIFSWIGIERNLPFTAHSWFFSLTSYNVTLFTKNIVTTGAVLVFVGAFRLFFVAKVCLLPKRHTFFLLFALIVGIICANPRPQIFSFSYFFLALYLLNRCSENQKSKAWLWLPLLSLLWVNVHGGTILILFCFEILYSILWILPRMKIGPFVNNTDGGFDGESLLKSNRNRKENWKSYGKHTLKVILTKNLPMILSTFATACLNPYGAKILTYGFMENNSATKMFVSEWQPIVLQNPFLLGILLVLAIYYFLHYKESVDIYVILPVLCCIGASAIYRRFILYGTVSALFVGAKILNPYIKSKWHTIKWNLFSFFLIFAISSTAPSLVSGEKEELRMDEETVSYLKESNFQRPFTCHNDGGRLIYEGLPTFIDQRFTNELMKESMLAECMQLEDKTIEEFTKEYQFDAFIFNKQSNEPLEDYIRLWDEWDIGFENDKYVVFVPCNKEQ